jgi:hypothetical protein
MARASLESLRPQAFFQFGLPAASPRLTELGSSPSGGEGLRVKSPGGAVLLLLSAEHPLQLAFEAALYDLLAEARYPAPRPTRAKGGSLIAPLSCATGAAAAACFAWPPGEPLAPELATAPQLLELGRLLARLHQLGETHPASVAESADGPALAARLPPGPAADVLLPLLRAPPSGLPTGAAHGRLGPACALFLGARCSAVLPSGGAASLVLSLDLAELLVAWALPLPQPTPALRALVSGYQALRRLDPDERDALWATLRHAAAREGARRLLAGAPEPLRPLEAADALGADEVRAAAG